MKFREEQIGDCRLILGDCLEVLPTLSMIDAVVTDPPYEFVPMGGGLGAKRQVYHDIYNQDLHIGFDPENFLGLSGSLTFFCAKAQIKRMIEFGENNKFRWNLTTFNKTNPTPLCGKNYLPDTEYIFHFWNGELGGSYADKSRFWVNPTSGDSTLHPTIKPIELMKKLIKVSTDGKHILDPFMGSGTTGIACIKLGRKFTGIEIDPTYFAVACKRIGQAYRQPDMFVEQQKKPEQMGMGI